MSGELGSALCQIVPEPISISICCLFPRRAAGPSFPRRGGFFKAVAGVENFRDCVERSTWQKKRKKWGKKSCMTADERLDYGSI